LENRGALVTAEGDVPLLNEQFARVSAHNRALCDQVIAVTRFTPSGLVAE
jgi:hypothetical protein